MEILPIFSKIKVKGREMFRGAAAVNLDAKGRVAIPTRYRAELMERTKAKWFVPLIFVSLVYYFIL